MLVVKTVFHERGNQPLRVESKVHITTDCKRRFEVIKISESSASDKK